MHESQFRARVRFGVFEADLRTGELRKHGSRIRLQQQPFQVLALLLERRGETVTRDELRDRLWAADTFVDFDHGLNKAINKIRDTLGDSATSPRFVETVARRGYRFIADVAVLDEPASDGNTAALPPIVDVWPTTQAIERVAVPVRHRRQVWLFAFTLASLTLTLASLL